MTDLRSKVRDWITTSALAALSAGLIWSAGVIWASVDQGQDLSRAMAAEVNPLRAEVDAGEQLSRAVDSITTRAQARSDSISRLIPDSLRTRLLPRSTYDSLTGALFEGWRAAGDDSVALAALRVLPLSPSDRQLVNVAEQLLGEERRHWKAFSEVTLVRAEGRAEPDAVTLAALNAQNQHRYALRGFAHAWERAATVEAGRKQALAEVIKRHSRTVCVARARLGFAVGLLLVSWVVLFAAVNFARTGQWSVTLGLRRKPVLVSDGQGGMEAPSRTTPPSSLPPDEGSS